MKTELPTVLKIEKIVDECSNHKTLVFKHKLDIKPGQFLQVWLPGIDEKPFSVSYNDSGIFWITVHCVGEFSDVLCKLKPGDEIGIRGPYGNGFEVRGKKILLVAGGCGTAPLSFLAEQGVKVDMIIGAKNKDELLFEERMSKVCDNVYVTTDDGSKGEKGFTTDVLKKLIDGDYSCVYTCGPEVMMKKVVEICNENNVLCQASLERYMKCGFGVCGQCCIDGLRVCKEGPVFYADMLKDSEEFGKYKRDATGKRVEL